MAGIFAANPSLSAEDGLKELYDAHTVLDTSLEKATRGGRKLIEAVADKGRILEEEVDLATGGEKEVKEAIAVFVAKLKNDITEGILTLKVKGITKAKVRLIKNNETIEVSVEDNETCEGRLAAG